LSEWCFKSVVEASIPQGERISIDGFIEGYVTVTAKVIRLVCYHQFDSLTSPIAAQFNGAVARAFR